MATFTLHARRAAEAARNAKLLARLALETGGDVEAERERHRAERAIRYFEFPDPVDLRGIPLIGRGIAGTSPGSRPDAICDR